MRRAPEDLVVCDRASNQVYRSSGNWAKNVAERLNPNEWPRNVLPACPDVVTGSALPLANAVETGFSVGERSRVYRSRVGADGGDRPERSCCIGRPLKLENAPFPAPFQQKAVWRLIRQVRRI